MAGGFRLGWQREPWALAGHHSLVGRFEYVLFNSVERPEAVLPVKQEHFPCQQPAKKPARPAHNYEYRCHHFLLWFHHNKRIYGACKQRVKSR